MSTQDIKDGSLLANSKLGNPNTDYSNGVEVIKAADGTLQSKSRFYFFVAAPPMTGGDLVIVQHCRELIKAGVDARFLYLPNETIGKTIDEFPPDVPVNYLDANMVLTENDFLMSGESQKSLYDDVVKWMDGSSRFPKVVMFNQAVHWLAYAFKSAQYLNKLQFGGLICATEFAEKYMQEQLKVDLAQVFKEHLIVSPVTKLPEALLAKPDSLSRSERKRKPVCKIAYINNVRKRYQETTLLPFAFLSQYPEYQDKVEFVEIKGCSHAQVLEHMRNSDIFICSGYMDSHNLPAVEAMAAGCHVLGYLGLSLPVEYFNQANGWWFDREGRIDNNVEILHQAVELYYAKDETAQRKRRTIIENGQRMVAEKFSPNSPNTNIPEAYRKIWEANIPAEKRKEVIFATFEKGFFYNP